MCGDPTMIDDGAILPPPPFGNCPLLEWAYFHRRRLVWTMRPILQATKTTTVAVTNTKIHRRLSIICSRKCISRFYPHHSTKATIPFLLEGGIIIRAATPHTTPAAPSNYSINLRCPMTIEKAGFLPRRLVRQI